jgi:hypothetical protein
MNIESERRKAIVCLSEVIYDIENLLSAAKDLSNALKSDPTNKSDNLKLGMSMQHYVALTVILKHEIKRFEQKTNIDQAHVFKS